MKQHFFVEGRYLGSREIPNLVRSLDGPQPHRSHVYFCPLCADIWGRLMTEPQLGWCQISTRKCRQHGEGTLACHPSWVDDPRQFGADWPDDAVKYEFEVMLERATKEANE